MTKREVNRLEVERILWAVAQRAQHPTSEHRSERWGGPPDTQMNQDFMHEQVEKVLSLLYR